MLWLTRLICGSAFIIRHIVAESLVKSLPTRLRPFIVSPHIVDGQYNFTGSGAAVTNQASLAGTWAGVTGTAVDIKTVATATASDSTSVWFGAGATTAKPAGNYAAVVTYTAVTNP